MITAARAGYLFHCDPMVILNAPVEDYALYLAMYEVIAADIEAANEKKP